VITRARACKSYRGRNDGVASATSGHYSGSIDHRAYGKEAEDTIEQIETVAGNT
jgi:hypothetical protein